MTNGNVFYLPIPVVVWGTGNVGRAAIRAVDAHPGLQLVAVIVATEAKVGQDAGALAALDRELGVTATSDVGAALALLAGGGAVVYAAAGELRPQEAVADISGALAGGAVVVSPSVYALYDHHSAPPELHDPVAKACTDGGSALFVNGIDPGWANDVFPVLLSGLAGEIDQIRCQEIFDYSTYDNEDSVRYLVGMGQPMDYEPPMVAPGIPSMVWGGQIRMIARALDAQIDELREVVTRAPLTESVTTALGEFAAGTQGALRFEVQGIVAGEPRIVIEHITRITAQAAPEWPQPAGGADGAHRVVIEGRPRIEFTVEATAENDNRSAGGNATAANRLVNAIPWLRTAPCGLYNGLEVPLQPSAYLRSFTPRR